MLERVQRDLIMDWKTLKQCSLSMSEDKDCSVRAVTAISGLPYPYIHKVFLKQGRETRKPTPTYILIYVLNALAITTEQITVKAKTIRTFEREVSHLKERFLVWTSGHVLAVINGKACDWSSGRLNRILRVEKVNLHRSYIDF